MTAHRIVLTMCLALCAIPPAVALPQVTGQHQSEPIDRSALVIRYFSPTRTTADELLRGAGQILRRSFLVQDRLGVHQVQNLFAVGSAIGVIDHADQVEGIIEQLRLMEAAAFPDQKAGRDGTTEVIVLQHASAEELQPVVEQLFARQSIQISIMADPRTNSLLIAGPKDGIDAARRVIASRDVRVPVRGALQLTCYVLQAADDAPASAVPTELNTHLRSLTGAKGFRLITTGVIRTRFGSGIQADLGSAQNHSARLNIARLTVDGDDAELERIVFQLAVDNPGGSLSNGQRYQFETTTQVGIGEYSVIGIMGDQPYFVVLRVDRA